MQLKLNYPSLKANYFIQIGCLFFCCLFLQCRKQESAPVKPNIVLFYADDLGWMDIAIQGSKYYETPNIDRIVMNRKTDRTPKQ